MKHLIIGDADFPRIRDLIFGPAGNYWDENITVDCSQIYIQVDFLREEDYEIFLHILQDMGIKPYPTGLNTFQETC